ncbi:TIGR01777 family oxidoreductase [Pseudorhodoferax sp. Leaf267]|uniref:TIGR01777 family oxidoreductase n=1 Tax=Pseudorhodoferax sp. Leaf267 TaxID=1736316 RepID=UPI0006FC911D|nr:TIGR01777 family oxidoreductase [Pseudorhodoferax sp. Leaf267]KQP12576.1 nucleoside-diphosphate sugar epimerase [Pseudorhodoferax sp. Leaf267]
MPSTTTTPAPIRFGPVPQHVLVTGGTGFIGRLLVQQLLRDGHQVTVWTRDVAAASRHLGTGVRCVARLQDVAQQQPCDVVINLAGARILGLPWTDARRAQLLASREGLTNRLVDWMAGLARRPWLLVSASAVGYYGVQAPGDDTALAEDAPPQPIFMSQLCQRWEQAALRAAPLGVEVVRLRLGVVLGRGGALPQLLLPISLGLGGPLAGGRQWFSWVHVEDLLRAIAHTWTLARQAHDAGQPPATPVYNVTAPGTVRQAEFSRIAARLMHRPSLFPTPGLPLRLLLGEQADLLRKGQRVVPAALLRSGFAFRFADAQAALADLR